MWVYRRVTDYNTENEKHLYQIGYYDPNGDFQIREATDNPEVAAMRVSYLNGGRTPFEQEAIRRSIEQSGQIINMPKGKA